MPYYECVYIARSDISGSQVEALTADLSRIVDDGGGKVTKTEYWGLKSLAYRIKKNRKGHYSLLNVDAPASALAEMERNMRLNEDVIRYMSVKVDELEEGPSIMMQNKSGRGRRRDREGGDRRSETAAKDRDGGRRERSEAAADGSKAGDGGKKESSETAGAGDGGGENPRPEATADGSGGENPPSAAGEAADGGGDARPAAAGENEGDGGTAAVAETKESAE